MILKDREILNISEIEDIINQTEVCYLAMSLKDEPYVLPFNFLYDDGIVYLHSGPDGKKIDILNQNPKVSIAFCPKHELFFRHENVACSYSMKYQSAIVQGEVEFIEEFEDKIQILNKIMKKYTGRDDFKFNTPAVNNVKVYKVKPLEIKGKRYKM